jgi:oligogalacturonide lyase
MFLRNVGAGQSPLTEIHEANPETGAEQRLDPTSQFASFSPNADASVFVGASSSHAQPTVILLLRALQRELTLCEHRATHPAGVSPVFSPDSRRVYFQSDHGGKSALYSINVEQLVEPT